ncbi:MAG: hypothetical protein BWY76_02915 [bacterium ADurb.Bin429]|nr:MAG: hypothetical protein BWY76_02915 [bacterium ADurb.Bin429]
MGLSKSSRRSFIACTRRPFARFVVFSRTESPPAGTSPLMRPTSMRSMKGSSGPHSPIFWLSWVRPCWMVMRQAYGMTVGLSGTPGKRV